MLSNCWRGLWQLQEAQGEAVDPCSARTHSSSAMRDGAAQRRLVARSPSATESASSKLSRRQRRATPSADAAAAAAQENSAVAAHAGAPTTVAAEVTSELTKPSMLREAGCIAATTVIGDRRQRFHVAGHHRHAPWLGVAVRCWGASPGRVA